MGSIIGNIYKEFYVLKGLPTSSPDWELGCFLQCVEGLNKYVHLCPKRLCIQGSPTACPGKVKIVRTFGNLTPLWTACIYNSMIQYTQGATTSTSTLSHIEPQ